MSVLGTPIPQRSTPKLDRGLVIGSLMFGADVRDGEKVRFGFGNVPQILSSNEEILLALRDIGPLEARLREDSMDEYYSRKQVGFLKPGAPGWKSFCIDGIHPRELGYTAWGEFHEWQVAYLRSEVASRSF